VGPGRWAFREYHIFERPSPRGRRYEIQTPTKQLVALCRIKRGSQALTFFGDEDEATELMRFVPKAVRQYTAAFDVVDGPTGKTIGGFRKKVYRPLNKSEWIIVDAEGEPLGMVTESAPTPTWLSRVLPVTTPRAKSFDVHWGQAIGGRITRRLSLPGTEHVQLDLSLDKRDVVDRRLALGAAVLVREFERNGERARR
jgi:hypothetical protein